MGPDADDPDVPEPVVGELEPPPQPAAATITAIPRNHRSAQRRSLAIMATGRAVQRRALLEETSTPSRRSLDLKFRTDLGSANTLSQAVGRPRKRTATSGLVTKRTSDGTTSDSTESQAM